jgi:hypothetical protein
MFWYVCISENRITNILNYEPNVPGNVEVICIDQHQYQSLIDRTHYFDIETKKLIPMPQAELDKKKSEQQNIKNKNFLDSTDWMILRHLRQKTLGIPSSLTENEYIELEKKRANAAENIVSSAKT